MGSGGPRGLQILLSGGSPVRGGFDSHTFPPSSFWLASLALGIALAAAPARAQSALTPRPWRPPVAADTLARPAGQTTEDTAAISPRRAAVARRPGFLRSPTGIMLRSLVVPGWGQATNRAWVKAGLVAGAESVLLVSVLHDTHRLSELPVDDPEYGRVWDRRQQHAWWLGAAVLLSLVDAYVDAHLEGFETDIAPEPKESGLSIAFRASWP